MMGEGIPTEARIVFLYDTGNAASGPFTGYINDTPDEASASVGALFLLITFKPPGA
jgi:hypothetical protein